MEKKRLKQITTEIERNDNLKQIHSYARENNCLHGKKKEEVGKKKAVKINKKYVTIQT